MASIQERLQLKRIPLDTWNIREQLCLASAVARSGDQNWMSVSRAMKTVCDPNRPADWYSQKSCAAQYGVLLEHVETPKRKKRNSEGAVETPQESILKRLTQERIAEIQKSVAEMNQHYQVLKSEIAELQDQSTPEERIREMWTEIENGKRMREREQARRAAWLREREERRARAQCPWRPETSSAPTTPTTTGPPSSPLLTSLLKSSPVVTTPQHITHPANVVDTLSPSAGAPTLSMLLEKGSSPGGGAVASAAGAATEHAAIEHIKSQLVQIERQYNATASACASPSTAPIVAPAAAPETAPLVPTQAIDKIDIDDIEIKAEDVYAFSDIDFEIAPVSTMHKNMPKSQDKGLARKEGEEANVELGLGIHSGHPVSVDTHQGEESTHTEAVTTNEMVQQNVVAPAVEDAPAETREQVPEIKISFPEVKFPTPEIKVIEPEDQKQVTIREESTREVETHRIKVEPPRESVEERPPPPPAAQEQPIIDIEDVPPQEELPEEEVVEDIKVANLLDIPLPPDPPKTEHVEHVEDEGDTLAPTEEPAIESSAEASDVTEEETRIIEESERSPERLPEGTNEEKDSEVENEADVGKEVIEDRPPLQEIREAHEQTGNDSQANVTEEESVKETPEGVEVKSEPAECADVEGGAEAAVPKDEKEPDDVHTETDDDTPMELIREEEKDGKKKRDYSRKKKPDSRTCSGSESAAEASAPESPMAGAAPPSDAERDHRLWKKSVMLVYSRLCAHKYASVFLRPITDEQAPGYSIAVRRPMDLGSIKRNIDSGVIRTTAEFQRDVLLMLSNAMMYNSSNHRVYKMAVEMHQEAESQLGMLLAAQAHAGLSEAPARRAPLKRRAPPNTPQPPVHK